MCQNKNPIIFASLKKVQEFKSSLFFSSKIPDMQKMEIIMLVYAIISKNILKRKDLFGAYEIYLHIFYSV